MSERTPADIAKNILEKELEKVELTKRLILSLELMEIDPDFFGADGEGFNWETVKEGSRTSAIRFYSGESSTVVQVKDLPQFTLQYLKKNSGNKDKLRILSSELIRRKRESTTVQ